jgi:hypothetical protein
MFQTQDITRKLNLYTKFSDVKVQEGSIHDQLCQKVQGDQNQYGYCGRSFD